MIAKLCGRRCVWMIFAREARVWGCRCGSACMFVEDVDSFPLRQIFALPILPNFRRGHAEFFRSMYTF